MPSVKTLKVKSTSPLWRLSPARKDALSASPNSSLVAFVTLSKDSTAFDGRKAFATCWTPKSDIAHV
jgi:hypothetical protein